jgi:hypothetical protein
VSRRAAIAAALLVLSLSAGAGVAIASFVATTTNPGNSFSAAGSFGGMRMASGQYTGNGADGRTIAVPFRPDVVIVKGDIGQYAVIRTETMGGDASKLMGGAGALVTNRIQSLTATGFTLGTSSAVNRNGTDYDWVALKGYANQLTTGSYTGTGGARSIGGIGFSPEYVIVLPAGSQAATQRSASMPGPFRFDTPAAAAGGIGSLDEDGFSVGAGPEANASGAAYHYVAWNAVPGLISQGSYAGDGGDDRAITGATFQPDFAMVKAGGAGSACDRPAFRTSSLTGGDSHQFANVADTSNLLQSLQPDGFEAGSDCRVNAAGQNYHWVALRNTGCPSQKTVRASEDAWVEQATADANHGGDPSLDVTARWRRVARTFVNFPLPTLPAGCSVTDARLRMHGGSVMAGRTLDVARVTAAWSEGSITWSNQPGVTGGSASAPSPSGPAWVEWDVTAQVQAMYAGPGNGLRISDAVEFSFGERTQRFASREAGSNQPELVLTFG